MTEHFATQDREDILVRLRAVELQASLNAQAISIHEAKCAGRYQIQIVLLITTVLLSGYDKLPLLLDVLRFLKFP
jgi:hypothetical protein